MGGDTYEKRFYTRLEKGKYIGSIKGFPTVIGGWCKHLKYGSEIDLRKHILSEDQESRGQNLWLPDTQGELVYRRTQGKPIAKVSKSPCYQGG